MILRLGLGIIIAAIVFLLFSFIGAYLGSSSAHAQPRCGPVGAILHELESKYREAPLLKMQNDRASFTLFMSKTGVWTWIAFPNARPGLACVMGAGNRLELLPSKFPKIFPAGSRPS